MIFEKGHSQFEESAVEVELGFALVGEIALVDLSPSDGEHVDALSVRRGYRRGAARLRGCLRRVA